MPDKRSVLLFSTTFIVSVIAYIIAFDRFSGRAYMMGKRFIEIKPICISFLSAVICTIILSIAYIRKKGTDSRLTALHCGYLALYGISGSVVLAAAAEYCFFWGFDSILPAFVILAAWIVLGIIIAGHRKYLHDKGDVPEAVKGRISLAVAAAVLLAVFKGFAVVRYYDVLGDISRKVLGSYWVDEWVEYLIEAVLTSVGAVIIGLIFRKKANRLMYWSAAAAMILMHHDYFLYAFVAVVFLAVYTLNGSL